MATTYCSKCGTDVPLAPRNNSRRVCKTCQLAHKRAYQRAHRGLYARATAAWRKRNRTRLPEMRRRARLKRDYDTAPETIDLMAAEQRHRCRICNAKRKLVIDHDHRNGRMRGLICNACNLMLGHAKDNPARLRAAASYIDHLP